MTVKCYEGTVLLLLFVSSHMFVYFVVFINKYVNLQSSCIHYKTVHCYLNCNHYYFIFFYIYKYMFVGNM